MSSSCVPASATAPSAKTQILSAPRMVESRWAITSVVRLAPRTTSSSAACTTFSDLASRADVASSKISSRGSRTRARAMATRCFWPPLNWRPRAPTCVS
mmetsp:Transcript_19416/g.57753  ORF Transcript_19416/g.57753 Transcript_19416/m.57753 type:complete len:99 (+) Transcript_19416:117-413(+)